MVDNSDLKTDKGQQPIPRKVRKKQLQGATFALGLKYMVAVSIKQITARLNLSRACFQSARTKEAMPRYIRRHTRRRPSDWIVNIGWIRKMRWLTPFQIVFVQSLVFRRWRGFRSQELRNHHVLIPRKTRNRIKVAFCQLFSLSRTTRRYARHGAAAYFHKPVDDQALPRCGRAGSQQIAR
jgi:hypothetical protein